MHHRLVSIVVFIALGACNANAGPEQAGQAQALSYDDSKSGGSDSGGDDKDPIESATDESSCHAAGGCWYHSCGWDDGAGYSVCIPPQSWLIDPPTGPGYDDQPDGDYCAGIQTPDGCEPLCPGDPPRGVSCLAGQTIETGGETECDTVRCNEGYTKCDQHTCARLSDSYFHCGACGNQCAQGQECQAGRCVTAKADGTYDEKSYSGAF